MCTNLHLYPPKDQPLHWLNGDVPFESCGIVTNAGSILGSGLGGHIDSNDFVLRFNGAITQGYEKDVGTKTTMRSGTMQE